MSAKAQEAFSFMVVVIGALLIVIIMTPFLNYDFRSAMIISDVLEAEDLLERLGDAVTRVYLSGNGTTEIVQLFSSMDFNITIVPKYAAITFNNNTKIKHFIANNISGQVIGQGDYLIMNMEGFINVTKVPD